MAVANYTKAGTKAAAPAKLDKSVFGVEVKNHELLKEAYVAYLANGRANLAVAKKRGEVSGGGRKPWKQKGTGRARFGSSRNPIWTGGGVAFGPTGNENYKKQMNVKAKRQAIRQALTLKTDSVIVIEDIKAAKTGELARLLMKVGAEKNVLIVVDNKTPELTLASRNLPKTKLVAAKYVNVFDVLNANAIVFTNAALNAVSEWLAPSAKAAEHKGETE